MLIDRSRILFALSLTTACIALGCASSRIIPREASTSIPTTQPDSPPLITIVVHSGYVAEGPMEYLIFAAWKDGRVIWSGDQTCGGAPLYKANLPAAQLALFMNQIEGIATKTKSLPIRHSAGPDSAYTQ